MGYLLDSILSSILLTVVLLLVLGGVLMWASMLKPFQNDRLNWFFSALMYVLFAFMFMFGGIINPMFFGFGYADEFKRVVVTEKYAVFLDYLLMGGGDGDIGTEYFRLHVLDRATGKRLYRKMLGANVHYIEEKNGLLLYGSQSKIVLWDISKGELIQTFDKETLPTLYTELQEGIDKLRYSEGDQYIEIHTKTGKEFHLLPYTQQLLTGKPPTKPFQYVGKVWELTPQTHSSKLMTLNGKHAFLEGKVLHVFTEAEKPTQGIILHYTTTDKTSFILTCLQADYSKRWEIKQTDLQASDWLAEVPRLDVSAVSGQVLFMNVGGFAFAIDAATGKVVWKSRL